MSALEFDVLKLAIWGLFASVGAFTWPHYDAAGLATYVVCKTGVKLWSYLKSIHSNLEDNQHMARYLAMVKQCENYDAISSLASPMNVLLTPGTILCVSFHICFTSSSFAQSERLVASNLQAFCIKYTP
jgi:hypothetical protein